MTRVHFSSVSTNFLTFDFDFDFEPTCPEFPATVNVVQGYVSCVSRDQPALEELEKFCSALGTVFYFA